MRGGSLGWFHRACRFAYDADGCIAAKNAAPAGIVALGQELADATGDISNLEAELVQSGQWLAESNDATRALRAKLADAEER